MNLRNDNADTVAVNAINPNQPNDVHDDVRELPDSQRLNYAHNDNTQYAKACKL